MKEPKSTRGLVHQAICNLNITLPIYAKVLWTLQCSQEAQNLSFNFFIIDIEHKNTAQVIFGILPN